MELSPGLSPTSLSARGGGSSSQLPLQPELWEGQAFLQFKAIVLKYSLFRGVHSLFDGETPINTHRYLKNRIFIKKKFQWSRVDLQCCVNSGVQHRESVICESISNLSWILFPSRSLWNIKKSSLCYTAGSYQLSLLCRVVYICQSQSPNLSLPPSSPCFEKTEF